VRKKIVIKIDPLIVNKGGEVWLRHEGEAGQGLCVSGVIFKLKSKELSNWKIIIQWIFFIFFTQTIFIHSNW
jgi:hypothetical protein